MENQRTYMFTSQRAQWLQSQISPSSVTNLGKFLHFPEPRFLFAQMGTLAASSNAVKSDAVKHVKCQAQG